MQASLKPRILVADDDLGVIASYRIVLEQSPADATAESEAMERLSDELFGSSDIGEAQTPWRVDFVDQGEDALEAVRAALADGDPYAAVFLDVRMPPGLDGFEVAEGIRNLGSTAHIVFVSGYSDYTDEDLIEAGGGNAKASILPKPVWPKELRRMALKHADASKLSTSTKRAR